MATVGPRAALRDVRDGCGVPASGLDFGAAVNPDAIIDMNHAPALMSAEQIRVVKEFLLK